MFLEQGNDPSIGQESMIMVFQLVQYLYQPVNNILVPPWPHTMGIGYPVHELGLLDHQSTEYVDFHELEFKLDVD